MGTQNIIFNMKHKNKKFRQKTINLYDVIEDGESFDMSLFEYWKIIFKFYKIDIEKINEIKLPLYPDINGKTVIKYR